MAGRSHGTIAMDDIKLRLARVHLGQSRMDVAVDDLKTSTPRAIRFRWQAGEPTDAPPDHWYDSICGEVKYQRGQEHKRASGRAMPWDTE